MIETDLAFVTVAAMVTGLFRHWRSLEMDGHAREPRQGGEDKQVVDKHGLSEFLHVSVSTIERMMAARQIPYMKLGRSVRFEVGEVLRELRSSGEQAG